MKTDTPKMIVAVLLAFIVVVGVLAGYNPFEILLPPDENRTPGTWVNAPLDEPKLEGDPKAFPSSDFKE